MNTVFSSLDIYQSQGYTLTTAEGAQPVRAARRSYLPTWSLAFSSCSLLLTPHVTLRQRCGSGWIYLTICWSHRNRSRHRGRPAFGGSPSRKEDGAHTSQLCSCACEFCRGIHEGQPGTCDLSWRGE
jgi:hypothetical protein